MDNFTFHFWCRRGSYIATDLDQERFMRLKASLEHQNSAKTLHNQPKVWWQSADTSYAADRKDLTGNESLRFHEALHELGMIDSDIQGALGLPIDPKNTKRISIKLGKDCITKKGNN